MMCKYIDELEAKGEFSIPNYVYENTPDNAGGQA